MLHRINVFKFHVLVLAPLLIMFTAQLSILAGLTVMLYHLIVDEQTLGTLAAYLLLLIASWLTYRGAIPRLFKITFCSPSYIDFLKSESDRLKLCK